MIPLDDSKKTIKKWYAKSNKAFQRKSFTNIKYKSTVCNRDERYAVNETIPEDQVIDITDDIITSSPTITTTTTTSTGTHRSRRGTTSSIYSTSNSSSKKRHNTVSFKIPPAAATKETKNNNHNNKPKPSLRKVRSNTLHISHSKDGNIKYTKIVTTSFTKTKTKASDSINTNVDGPVQDKSLPQPTTNTNDNNEIITTAQPSRRRHTISFNVGKLHVDESKIMENIRQTFKPLKTKLRSRARSFAKAIGLIKSGKPHAKFNRQLTTLQKNAFQMKVQANGSVSALKKTRARQHLNKYLGLILNLVMFTYSIVGFPIMMTCLAFNDRATQYVTGYLFHNKYPSVNLGLGYFCLDVEMCISWLVYGLTCAMLAQIFTVSSFLHHDFAHGSFFQRDTVRHYKKLNEWFGSVNLWINGGCYFTFQELRSQHVGHHTTKVDYEVIDQNQFEPYQLNILKACEYMYVPLNFYIMKVRAVCAVFWHQKRLNSMPRTVTIIVIRALALLFIARMNKNGGIYCLIWTLLGYFFSKNIAIHVLRFGDVFSHSYDIYALDSKLKPAHKEYDMERTYTIMFPWYMKWFECLYMLNFNYHNAHHNNTSIPWYSLPTFHNMIDNYTCLNRKEFEISFFDAIYQYHTKRVARVDATDAGFPKDVVVDNKHTLDMSGFIGIIDAPFLVLEI